MAEGSCICISNDGTDLGAPGRCRRARRALNDSLRLLQITAAEEAYVCEYGIAD